MTPPPQPHANGVIIYVQAAAELAGVDPAELTTEDLQVMAHAIRVADPDPNAILIANYLDSLSELGPDDIAFLESIPAETPEDAGEGSAEEQPEQSATEPTV